MELAMLGSTCDFGNNGNLGIVNESTLLSAAKRGQPEAFAELCQRHSKRIFHTIFRITRNREDAEDALQDSYLNAFVHFRKFDGRSTFTTWLTRIAINSALMKIRKNRGYRELPMEGPADEGQKPLQFEFTDRSPDPEQRYAQKERDGILTSVVRGLRPAIRRAVEIRQLQECSVNETAQILGISVAATKGRLFQARAALRKERRLRAISQGRVRRAA